MAYRDKNSDGLHIRRASVACLVHGVCLLSGAAFRAPYTSHWRQGTRFDEDRGKKF
ncbi:hypothetical protein [Dialister hominis]|uniref:hypothetical protein n=1 Tax=Dialister hominis TaxID=2582419 RepID=UPI003FEF71F9